VAIAKTIKNFFVSFASLTLIDAFAATGDFVAAVDGCDFFLLIILVFKKSESLILQINARLQILRIHEF
jgi:hypothetical protein